ncbi:hypothetical protein HPB47_026561 [Ixodes persulcatus]|uniref:Uncharacterized protein n=1 Tax=Ixodes persulcatus TaxID=34615 RepID=A0AC60PYZ2_IXOPE|nr:hypothetical protein HPB47_026561 [Ixodes persulcatus]
MTLGVGDKPEVSGEFAESQRQNTEPGTERGEQTADYEKEDGILLSPAWSPNFRPFTESRGQEKDECASGSESSSKLEDGRPKVGHPKEPATGGGCAGKGPSGVTIEPGRDRVHLKTSSCPRQGGAETKNSDVVTRQRPRPMKKRDPHAIEPRTHSSSASKEPGGGNNEPGTTQRGSKRRQGSSPVVQPGIPLDRETKGDLRDCSFAPARKSKEKNLNSSSEAKDKLGVG